MHSRHYAQEKEMLNEESSDTNEQRKHDQIFEQSFLLYENKMIPYEWLQVQLIVQSYRFFSAMCKYIK
jgi:hypothetical protein